MSKAGLTTVNLRNDRLRELEELYRNDKKRPATQEFDEWLDNMLYEFVGYERQFNLHGPFISIDSITDSHVVLSEYAANKHVLVNINSKEKRLECEKDSSSDCIHVGYCLATPSVFKILIKKGFKDFETDKDKKDNNGISEHLGNKTTMHQESPTEKLEEFIAETRKQKIEQLNEQVDKKLEAEVDESKS
ncbi:MAG TPA: hypothetical protein VH500_16640 [Nitrososphaeraceae archaeon]|jgi:hypothetical protein